MSKDITILTEEEMIEFFNMIEDLTSRYAIIKSTYIFSEEIDPELNTNLQPMNEFKASLDHIFKMFNRLTANDNTETKKMDLVREEYKKIRSHLCRAFFDIADACSIDIRQQIMDDLSIYSNEVINLALPDYYSVLRPEIEKLGQKIGSYRLEKGSTGIDEEIKLFNEYHLAIKRLIEIMNRVTESACSLKEAQDHININRRNNTWTTILIALGSSIVTGIATYIVTMLTISK